MWHADSTLQAPNLGQEYAAEGSYRGAEGEVEDRDIGRLCLPQLPHTHLGTR